MPLKLKQRFRETLPWDQLPDETPWSWCLAWNYIQAGNSRSLERLANTMVDFNGDQRKAPGLRALKELSRKHSWVERAGKWDVHLMSTGKRAVELETQAAQKRAAENHAAASKLLIEAGVLVTGVRLKRLRRLNKQHDKAIAAGDEKEAERLEAQILKEAPMLDAAKVIQYGVTMESISLGMPTSVKAGVNDPMVKASGSEAPTSHTTLAAPPELDAY